MRDDLIEAYIAAIDDEWHSASSRAAYRGDLIQLRDELLGIEGSITSWRAVTTGRMQAVISGLPDRYKVSTVRRKVTVYGLFFAWAANAGRLRRDPMARAAYPAQPAKINDEISYATLEAFCELPDRMVEMTLKPFWAAARDKAIFRTLVDTGLFNSEVMALRVGDYRGGAVHTGALTIALPPPARAAVDAYLANARRYFCPALGGAGVGSDMGWVDSIADADDNEIRSTDILFPNRSGGMMTRAGLATIVQQYARTFELDLPPGITMSAMSIRRSYIVRMLRQGTPEGLLASRLGIHQYSISEYVRLRRDNPARSLGGADAPLVAKRPSRLPRTA